MPKITEVTQTSINNYMKKKEHGRIKHPSVIRHPKTTTQQLPTSHHEVQSELMSDQNSNCIPTIVKEQINPTKKDDDDDDNNAENNQDFIHDLVSKSTVKVLNNKAKYSKCSKHKVLVMGDSHLRGCAAKMIASLDTRFDVCGVVKPGSNIESLMEMAKGEVGKLTMNDFLIICSGTNDIERNHSRNAFKNITNFIKSVNHINKILISVPYRHDATNDLHINSKIKSLNSKLLTLAKIFSHVNIIEPSNYRLLFAKHGLHLNESGKELLSNQLVLHIFTILEEVNVIPITLGWYDKNLQVNAPSIDSLTPNNCQLLTEQAPKRIKKLPVTRKDDFYGEFN